MEYTVENTAANNLIDLGKKRLSKQLIISVNRLGHVQMKGNLEKKIALLKLEEIVQQEDAMNKEWLPEDLDSFPLLPLPLADVLRNGNMAKSVTAASINWMLRKTGGKIGRDKFSLWFYPVNKENLVYTSGLVSKLPDTFTLNMILEWSDMAGCSMSHGNSGALKPASGVTNHLSFIKIVLNIIFLVVGHNPLTWHRATAAPSTGPPPARTSPALAGYTSPPPARSFPAQAGHSFPAPARNSSALTGQPAPSPARTSSTQAGRSAHARTPSAARPSLPGRHSSGQASNTSSPAIAPAQPLSASPSISPVLKRNRPLKSNLIQNIHKQGTSKSFKKPPAKLFGKRTPMQPATIAKTRERVAAAKKSKKDLFNAQQEKERSLTVEEEDNIEMAMGISISEQEQSENSLSSQQYREDEKRRRELLYESQDMMAESTTEYEPHHTMPHLEEQENMEEQEDLEEGEIPAPTVDITPEDSSDEDFEGPRASQYVPPMMMVEKRKQQEETDESEEEDQENYLHIESSTDEEAAEVTMKDRWVGEKDDPSVWNSAKVMKVPESRSKHVGMRPQPTVFIEPRLEIVQVPNMQHHHHHHQHHHHHYHHHYLHHLHHHHQHKGLVF